MCAVYLGLPTHHHVRRHPVLVLATVHMDSNCMLQASKCVKCMNVVINDVIDRAAASLAMAIAIIASHHWQSPLQAHIHRVAKMAIFSKHDGN